MPVGQAHDLSSTLALILLSILLTFRAKSNKIDWNGRETLPPGWH